VKYSRTAGRASQWNLRAADRTMADLGILLILRFYPHVTLIEMTPGLNPTITSP